MMKKVLCIAGCVLIAAVIHAQSDPNARVVRDNNSINPVPPSPEMASLGKFGEQQISKSTGAPSVSVPIYTLQVDGVSLPIALQFAATGFRPSDVGSYLGMHWVLTGLGGISRSIRGHVDEGGYLVNSVDQSYINSVSASVGTAATQSDLSTMNNGGTDISQDAYTVSAVGMAAKFFLNSQKNFTWSVKSDNKLYHQVSFFGGENHIKFWIYDTKGNRYNFETEERTYISSQNGYSRNAVTQDGVTAWKLTKIITAKGREINFSYADYNCSYSVPSQDVYTTPSNPPTSPDEFTNCGCSTTENWKYGTNLYQFHTKIISSITTDKETIEFTYVTDGSAANYQKKLTQIAVKNASGVSQKIFDLTYGYFSGNARLKLTEVKQTDVNSVLDPVKHNFTYYENYGIVATTSRAIDAHKYYNGATSNWHLVVSNHADFPYGSADRSVQPQYAQETMLKEIIYPTGGKSEFIYESNGDVSANDLGSGLRVKEIKDRDVNGTLLRHKEFVYRNYYGLPLLVNNVPANVFYENIICTRVQFTSDAQYSIAGNTIPPSEEFFYEEVDELQKGSPDLKTTFKFTNAVAMEGDLQILPLQEIYYKHNGSSYVPVRQKDYEYNLTGFGSYPYSVNQFAVFPAFQQTIVHYGGTYEWCTLFCDGIAQGLPRYQTRIRNSRIKVKEIDGSDNLETITDLTYGSNHEMPTGISTTNSKGQTEQKNIYYTPDGSLVSSPSLSGGQLSILSGMVSANMLDFTIAQERSVASTLTDATRTHYDLYHSLYYLPKEIFDHDGSGYYSRTEFLSYNTDGNLTALKKASDFTTSYVWDYQKSYTIAEVKNAVAGDIAFTSFETSEPGGWSGISGSFYVASPGATGARYYSQSSFSISKSSLNSSTAYYVTYWSTSGSAYSITGTSGGWPKTIGSVTVGSNTWYCYQHKITGQSTITVAGSGDIDELRLHPADALMTSYTYNPIYGITTANDNNNRITYYEYDGLGRLAFIRDQQQNILKRFDYRYNVLPNQ